MSTLRFVLIEDSQATAEMIKDFLSMTFPESEVLTYTTGEEAIQKINIKPDLFIIDYNLDSVNPKALRGIQIMMKLRNEYKAPVIFLSSEDSETLAANTLKAGADDYVTKNSHDSFSRLEISIRNILNSTHLKEEVARHRRFIGILVTVLLVLVGIVLYMRTLS